MMVDANPDEVVAALESAIDTAGDRAENGSEQREWAGVLADLTGEYWRLLDTLDGMEDSHS